MSNRAFIIEDWAGNVCFFGKEFKTFEDAWEFLHEQFKHVKDEDDLSAELGEYSIVQKGEAHV